VVVLVSLSGRVDRGPDGPGDQVQDLQHPAEVVATEFEHDVAQAEPLVLGEQIDDRLRALGDQLVAQAEAQ